MIAGNAAQKTLTEGKVYFDLLKSGKTIPLS